MQELIYGIDNIVLLFFAWLFFSAVMLLYLGLSKIFGSHSPASQPAELQAPPRINTEQYFGARKLRCPICMEQIKCEVEATCGHVYCAQCIATLWRSKYYEQLQCPYCRRIVNIFFEYIEKLIGLEIICQVKKWTIQSGRTFVDIIAAFLASQEL